MNEYPGNPLLDVVVLFTQQACLLVDQLGDKFLDLFLVGVWRVLSLFEEVSGRVLQGLHTEFKYYSREFKYGSWLR